MGGTTIRAHRKKSCGARTEIKFSAAPPIYITLSYKV